ncbi:MAG TPA: alanine racemase [Acidimicrobiales bacterium]|nr:alanine racemase [Acidimicrobiales bacterium]
MADTGPALGTDAAESSIVPAPAAAATPGAAATPAGPGSAVTPSAAVGSSRLAWAEVDLDAITANCAVLAGLARPAALCAVVKAGAYGHGALPAAKAALAGGATWLAVALVEEGIALREGGIEARILLLSEPLPQVMEAAAANGLTPTVYTPAGIEAARKAASAAPGGGPLRVHVKIDTGMHRVGANPDEVLDVGLAVDAAAELHLEGLWTHLAAADEPEHDEFTAAQLRRFGEVRRRLAAAGIRPDLVHAANSSALLAMVVAADQDRRGDPAGVSTLLPAGDDDRRRDRAGTTVRNDIVRCGITVYGYPPSAALADRVQLRPAMSLKAGVAYVRRLGAGERLSYGLRYALPTDSVIATVPLGYADGVPRRFSAVGGQALIGGRRLPIAGRVTMDQLLVDCGPDSTVAPGDEVVLLGRQGAECIDATEWAARLDTVPYEILCGISGRVARRYLGGAGA